MELVQLDVSQQVGRQPDANLLLLFEIRLPLPSVLPDLTATPLTRSRMTSFHFKPCPGHEAGAGCARGGEIRRSQGRGCPLSWGSPGAPGRSLAGRWAVRASAPPSTCAC
jgi:hypothetical protein